MAEQVTIKPNELNLLASLERNLIYGSINACKLYLETDDIYYCQLAYELDARRQTIDLRFSNKLKDVMTSKERTDYV